MRIRGVLFDWGGTLLDYRREEIFKAILREKGFEVGSREVAQAYDVIEPEWNRKFPDTTDPLVLDDALREGDRMILEQLHLDCDLDEMSTYVKQNWLRMDQELPRTIVRRRYPDVLPCLNQIRVEELRTGIVSNISSEAELEKELEALELLDYFPVLVASGSVGFAKPARQIFEKALALVNLEPEEVLFVGNDLNRDYHGALDARMNPVLIDRAGCYAHLSGIKRISSLEQISRMLE